MSDDRRYAMLVTAYLVAALVLGGASAAGLAANLLLQLAGIAIATVAILRLRTTGLASDARSALILLGAIMLIGPLQLVPLPPAIWTLLPGREPYVAGLAQMGVAPPWLGLSLTPELTLRASVALVPAAALFLAVLAMDGARRRWLAWAVVGVAIVSFLLGLAQLAGGMGSPLYFYDVTNAGSAVGFFSNRNHLATLLLASLPMIGALMSEPAGGAALERPKIATRVSAVAAMLFVSVGVLATQSRAGLLLLVPTALLTLAMGRRARTGIVSLPIVAAALLLLAGAIGFTLFGPGADRMAQKTGSALETEVRIQALPLTAEAGRRHFPFGSGLGSFDGIYRGAAPTETLSANYVNHAHNDYIELWLTAGLPFLVLLGAFLLWYAGAVRRTWKQRPEVSGPLPRAAALVIAIMLAHSMVDYPLRTAALSTLFALAAALMLSPPRKPRSSSRKPGSVVTEIV
ncbi:O-antigen ligase family protein [Sphingomonas sp. 1P06PA]|uniref:O-antigen ligase family protein n=1 Tax=Sphingomonas sp. 1P06PA TaxID=554121 RepID=UPI0039A72C29